MTDSNPLVFYDISSPLEPRSYAPNPSKTRYALSFKGVPFKSVFVDLPDIPNVRKGLNCPATRKLDDGSDYYTLPVLQDPSSGEVIGDTLDIANYLEDKYPNSGGSLFSKDSNPKGLSYESPHKDTTFIAPLTIREGIKNEIYANFNWHVDCTFTNYVILVGEYMPFNPKSAEVMRTTMAKRAHLNSWDDLKVHGEPRKQLLAAFNVGLTTLAELYPETGPPYLEGEKATYADMIVGGWLNMLSFTMPEEEWKEFRTWHGGKFARLYDALRENYFKCQ